MSERRRVNRSQRAKALALPQGLNHVRTKGRVARPAGSAGGSSPTLRQSGIWYSASLDGEQVAAGRLATLCESFAVTVRDAGEPPGACLFAIADATPDGKRASESRAATAIFISPGAISVVPKILAALNAQPSPAPDRARASLLVGRPQDWDLLPRSTH